MKTWMWIALLGGGAYLLSKRSGSDGSSAIQESGAATPQTTTGPTLYDVRSAQFDALCVRDAQQLSNGKIYASRKRMDGVVLDAGKTFNDANSAIDFFKMNNCPCPPRFDCSGGQVVYPEGWTGPMGSYFVRV